MDRVLRLASSPPTESKLSDVGGTRRTHGHAMPLRRRCDFSLSMTKEGRDGHAVGHGSGGEGRQRSVDGTSLESLEMFRVDADFLGSLLDRVSSRLPQRTQALAEDPLLRCKCATDSAPVKHLRTAMRVGRGHAARKPARVSGSTTHKLQSTVVRRPPGLSGPCIPTKRSRS